MLGKCVVLPSGLPRLLQHHVFSPVLLSNIHRLSLEDAAASARDRVTWQIPISFSVRPQRYPLSALKENTCSKTGCCNGYAAFPERGESNPSHGLMMLLNIQNALGQEIWRYGTQSMADLNFWFYFLFSLVITHMVGKFQETAGAAAGWKRRQLGAYRIAYTQLIARGMKRRVTEVAVPLASYPVKETSLN